MKFFKILYVPSTTLVKGLVRPIEYQNHNPKFEHLFEQQQQPHMPIFNSTSTIAVAAAILFAVSSDVLIIKNTLYNTLARRYLYCCL